MANLRVAPRGSRRLSTGIPVVNGLYLAQSVHKNGDIDKVSVASYREMLPLPTTQAETAPAARSLSIIVADDVDEIQQLLREYLVGAGHTVECASTGHEVLRLLARRHFDLVITDVLMPDGDGLDVIVAAKRSYSATRILAISGGGKYMVAGECLRIAKGVGAHGLLLKPFNRQQLLAAIEHVLRG